MLAPGMRRRNFVIPEHLTRRMKQAAQHMKVSEGEIVRRAVHAYLAARRPQRTE